MIESIWMKNFRKHASLKLEFDPQYNLVHGRNNAGKSTIFYAIEYALFGNITGFKKIEQVTSFEKKQTGVQLIFTARDGNRYKLQRMHDIGKKHEARGSFTLKRILPTVNELGTNDEQYILSSDHGHHEEELSLKINELLGVSKRYFGSAINFQQGSIISILNGDAKLDIVFGITAASTLGETFGGIASDYEKEIKQKESFEAQKRQASEERKENARSLQEREQESATLTVSIQAIEQEARLIDVMQSDVEFLKDTIKAFDNVVKDTREARIALDAAMQQQAQDAAEFGSITGLDARKSDRVKRKTELSDVVSRASTNIENARNQLRDKERVDTLARSLLAEIKAVSEKLVATGAAPGIISSSEEVERKLEASKQQSGLLKMELDLVDNARRDLERKAGDVGGMLRRRQDSSGKATCEYCGAPISDDKIAQEIKQLENEITEINKQLASSNTKGRELKEKQDNLANVLRFLESLAIATKKLEETIKPVEKQDIALMLPSLEARTIAISAGIKELETVVSQEQEQIEKFKLELGTIDGELAILNSNITRAKNVQNRIDELKKALGNTESSINNAHDAVYQRVFSVRHLINGTLQPPPGSNTPAPASLDFFKNLAKLLEPVNQSTDIEEVRAIGVKLTELILRKVTENQTSIKFMQQQLQNVNLLVQEARSRLLEIDKRIATLDSEISRLERMKALAEKYKTFEDLFDKYRKVVRESITRSLESEIARIHTGLSVDDEFSRIELDPTSYVLSITPKHVTTNMTYPAALFEGGGHKLILGLAYKIAIGSIVGRPPFLLIDEPTEFMDTQNRQNLLANLQNVAKATQLFLITHQDVDKINGAKKVLIAR